MVLPAASPCAPDDPLAALGRALLGDRSSLALRFGAPPPSAPSAASRPVPRALLPAEPLLQLPLLAHPLSVWSPAFLHQPGPGPLCGPWSRAAPRPSSDALPGKQALVSGPPPVAAAGGWSQEFLRASDWPTTAAEPPSLSPPLPAGPQSHSAFLPPRAWPPLGSRTRLHTPPLQSVSTHTPADEAHAWNRAFTHLDHTLSSHGTSRPRSPDNTVKHPSSACPSGPDALARTAASLVEIIESRQQSEHKWGAGESAIEDEGQGATWDKFTSSGFMDLMRKLRDGQVQVEGDKVVEQIAPTSFKPQLTSQMHHHATTTASPPPRAGGVWAPEDSASGPKAHSQGHMLCARPEHQVALPGVSGAHHSPLTQLHPRESGWDTGITEMNAFFEERDADLERSQRRAAMNQFQGDGGAVIEDLEVILSAADQVGRPEWQSWKTTHVPGATERWSEELVEPGTDFRFDNNAMVGRALSIQDWQVEHLHRSQRIPSAQQREWHRLQQNWDSHFEQAADDQSQVEQSDLAKLKHLSRLREISRDSGYQFQVMNPYMLLHFSQTSHHHSVHMQSNHGKSPTFPHCPLESVLQLEAEVLKHPDCASTWLELGLKQQENEKEDLAIQALRRAIQLDSAMAEASLALAISYTNENRKDEALDEIQHWIKAVLSQVPKYRDAIPWKLFAEQATGEGLEQDGQCIQKHRLMISTLIKIARLGGRSEGSASIDPDVQVALGVLFNSSEEFEKATDCFGAALAVKPEDPLLFNRLGATLANSGKPDQAIECYERALELLPTYIRARYNLSISLINLGQYQQSTENLLRALEMQESESSHLCELMESSGVVQAACAGEGDHLQQRRVTSEVLWKTLELSCSLLNRPDLVEQVHQRDLHALKHRMTFPDDDNS